VDAPRAEFSPDVAGVSPGPPAARSPKAVWYGADLLLVALVAVLAVAAFVTARGQLRQRQARDRITQDLTVAVAAFQSYFSQHGSTPADAAAGVVPKGMAPFLTGLDWTAPTPAGGHYQWINFPSAAPASAESTSAAPNAAEATSAAPTSTESTSAESTYAAPNAAAPNAAESTPTAPPSAAPNTTAPIGGVIAITAFPPSPALTLSLADLREIDRALDDGNLATGKFRLGFNGWPVLTVRARPDSP
jgi:type II secretory pathway pseudopilin PulG